MTCFTIPAPDGGSPYIACVRMAKPRPRQCQVCGREPAPYECDGPKPKRKSGTCDKHLCDSCTQQKPAPNGDTYDLCPECAKLAEQPQQARLF